MKSLIKMLAFAAAAALALVSSDGWTQTNPPTPPSFAALGGQTIINATSSSSRVALPVSTVPFGAITVYNSSTTVDAYVALGDSTVAAVSSAGTCAAPTFTMCLVKAGTSIVIWAVDNTYIAGITSSSTASLVIYQGSGGVQLSAIYSGTSLPSGPAGGDLAGTYPNPTVVKASSNGAASFSPLSLSGTILTGGTGTTNFPALFIQPTGTTAATTWSTTGTGIGMNLASGFTGNFIDLHLTGGGSIFKVDSFGAATSTSKMQGQYFIRTGAVSGPAWTTVGAGINSFSNTFTDTTSSGTVAAQYVNAFKAPTIAASAGTVYTNSYNTYFENPVAGTNVTQTNAWALGVDSLKVAGTTVAIGSGSINMGDAGSNINFKDNTGSRAASFLSGNYALFGTGQVVGWGSLSAGTLDTGVSRDSVLGANNVDIGNGTANDKSGTLNTANLFLNGGAIVAGMTNPVLVVKTAGTSKDAIDWENAAGNNIGVIGNDSAGNGLFQVKDSSATARVALGVAGGVAQITLTNSSNNTFLTSSGAAALQIGAVDIAAPVAQIIGVQNVIAGTTDTAGVQTTIKNSRGTGAAGGGNIVFQYAPHDTTHTVNTFTGSASPYTIGFTAGNITTYPIGTVMTVSGCATATLNGTYTVTASSSGSVTATTSATGTGSPTTCLIVGNTSQNAWVNAVTINGDTGAASFITGGSNTTPAINFGDAGTGFYKTATNQFAVTSNGTEATFWDAGGNLKNGASSASYQLAAAAATSTVPTIIPNRTDTTTGWGAQASGNMSAVVGGAEVARYVTGGMQLPGALIATGSAPTATGSCTHGAQTGGNTTGTIVLTCAAQTLILTFTTTAPTGWMCEAIDQTTTADTMKQTSNTTTSATLTGTTAASDVILFQCRAY